MKRFLSLFLAFIFVIGVFFSTPVIASATSGTGSESTELTLDYYKELVENTISDGLIRIDNWVYSVSENTTDVSIKAFIATNADSVTISTETFAIDDKNYNVIGIEANAFEYCDSLTQLTIPTFITIINENAFDDSSLTLITYKGHLGAWENAFTGDLGEIALSTTVCEDVEISYDGNENIITATCSCGVVCGTLTLEAIDDIIYNGNSYEVSVKVAGTVPGYTEGAGLSYSVNDGDDEEANVNWKPLENDVLPKDAGEYKATFELKVDEEVKASAIANFEIKYLEVPENAYSISTPDHQNDSGKWYKDTITVTPAENYTISDSLAGTYGDSITISNSEQKFHLKNIADQMTDAISLSEDIKFDNTEPTVAFKIGETDLTEDIYSTTDVQVSVVTDDVGSGVKEDSVEYFIGDNTTVVENIDAWTKVEGPITVEIGGSKKVFVKVSDNVGNETIVSSPAIIEPASLTASDFIFNKPESWTYGDTDKSISITPKEGVNVSTENISVKYYSVVDGKETEVGAPINAGTYKVKIDVNNESQYKDIEDLTGEDWEFTIVPKTITSTLKQQSGEYNRGPHAPSVDFDNLCGNETLVKDTDYTISYSDDTTNVGDVTVTVKLLDTLKAKNYTFAENKQEATLTYKITPKIVSKIDIEDIAAQTYTGNKLEPSVTVTINDETQPLADTEYEVTYGENENAGIGSVTVLLGSNYSYTGDEQLTKTFTINPKTISAGYQIGGDGIVYNGAETLQPKIIFTEVDDSSVTIDNVDCEVNYYRGEVETTDLTSAGTITAKITLEENGNYTFETSADGSQIYEETLAYTILPKPITVALAQTSGTYNGKPHTTDIKFNDVVTTDKFELGEDFLVKYYRDDMTIETDDFTSVGEIKAVVTLKNTNYTFADDKTTATLTYTIENHVHNWKFEASGAVITATCQNTGCNLGGSGKVTLVKPEDLVYNGKEKTVDYTVTEGYEDVFGEVKIQCTGNCIDVGTYVASYIFNENIIATVSFTITPRTIIITDIEGLERVYDGTTKVDLSTATKVVYTNGIDGKPLEFDLSKAIATADNANVGAGILVTLDGNITVKGDEKNNYQCVVLDDNRITVNITPATLTITPDAKTSEQYYKLPGLTYKVTGLIGTDTLTKAPALTTNADIKKTGDYTITATGAEASANYKITYAAGKMTITEHKNHIVATDGWKETVQGTCMVAGKEAGTCTLCSGTVTRDSKIDPNNHKLITKVTKKETCTQDGEALVTCANGCKYSLKTALPADGESHTFATEFTVNNSTCVAKGSKYKPCQNPGCSVKSEYAEIPVNPDAHTKTEIINVKAENCTEEGYTGDTYCSDCKKVVKPGVEIPAKGHTEGDWIVDKPASFTEEGSQHKECTVCKTELKKEAIAKLALDTPEVQIANDSKGIKVTWSQDTDATGYTVYRSEYNPTTKKWSKWKNRGTAAATKKSWVDKTVKEGVTYKFTVRGVNGNNKSAFKETNGLLYVSAPTVTASISSTGLLAKWNKINNATGYIVYRSQLGSDGKWAKWVRLGTTAPEKNTWYDDKAVSGVTYRYTVRAVVNNVQSGFTASASVVYLAQPLLKISNTSAGITGKWEPIAGATGYIIYRSEYNASTKKWTKWLNLGTTKATAKTFTDKTAKSGYTYRYTIRAINGKFKSTYQASNKLIFLAQPTLKISNVASGIQGTWNQVSGATGYIIYRSELKDGKWNGWTSLGTAKATAKSFTDKTVKSGVTYKYTIRAKNGANKSSYVATGAVVFLSVPTVKISSGITGVNVSWSKITGATSYLVYRREVVNGKWSGWTQLKTVAETSLVDETAKSGTQYRYAVRALNGKSRSMYTSTKTLHYLAAPTVTVEKATDGVKVNWTQVAGVTGYTIYRAELGADGKWSKWVTLGTASDKHSSCKDKTAKANITYKYTVRAVNGKVKSAYVSGAQITNTAQ